MPDILPTIEAELAARSSPRDYRRPSRYRNRKSEEKDKHKGKMMKALENMALEEREKLAERKRKASFDKDWGEVMSDLNEAKGRLGTQRRQQGVHEDFVNEAKDLLDDLE